jgi:carboxypeptidase D
MFSKYLSIVLAIGASGVAALPLESASKDRRSFIERDGTNFTVFEHAATGAKLEFVTNSGICETTPGVNQYSGYLSVGTNMNMWFWFFESRNKPTTAPLATWFNGGPGCSSMIGLFQEVWLRDRAGVHMGLMHVRTGRVSFTTAVRRPR